MRRVTINVDDSIGVWVALGKGHTSTPESVIRKLYSTPGAVDVHHTPQPLLAPSLRNVDRLYQQLVAWVRQTFKHRTLEERYGVADRMYRKADENRSFWLKQPPVMLFDAAMRCTGTRDCGCGCTRRTTDAARKTDPCHSPANGQFSACGGSRAQNQTDWKKGLLDWKKEMRAKHPHVEFEPHDDVGLIIAHDDGTPVGHYPLMPSPVEGVRHSGSDLDKAAIEIAAMPAAKRDDTEIGDFPGHASGYNLYEARKLTPKPSDKLKRVTSNNSFNLWQDYDYVANVDGTHFGVTKQEDPDDDEGKEDENGNLKQFVYSYEPLDDARLGNKMVITHTSNVDELFVEMRKATNGA